MQVRDASALGIHGEFAVAKHLDPAGITSRFHGEVGFVLISSRIQLGNQPWDLNSSFVLVVSRAFPAGFSSLSLKFSMLVLKWWLFSGA